MSDLSLEIARWIGKSGFIKDWDRCQREADGLLEYLREQGLSLAAPPPLDRLDLERLGRAIVEHQTKFWATEPCGAECARDIAREYVALRDEGETT